MATIVIGIGNPVLSDDRAGLEVARRIAELLPTESGIAVRELYVGGLRLMEAMAGYDRAILVDSMATPGAAPGLIRRPSMHQLFHTRNTRSTHDANLAVALELGRSLGLHLPSRLLIWAIEAADVESFGERLTEAVERAVPLVVDSVMRELRQETREEESA